MLAHYTANHLSLSYFSLISKTFNEYTLSNAPDGVCLRFYYSPANALEGDIHIDEQLLTAIERLAQFLKTYQLVKNTETLVVDDNLLYANVRLKKQAVFSPKNVSTELNRMVLKKDCIECVFTGPKLDDFCGILASYLKVLHLNLKSSSSPKPKL